MLKLTEISTIGVDHVSFYLFTYFIYLFYISYILFIYLFIDLLIDWLIDFTPFAPPIPVSISVTFFPFPDYDTKKCNPILFRLLGAQSVKERMNKASELKLDIILNRVGNWRIASFVGTDFARRGPDRNTAQDKIHYGAASNENVFLHGYKCCKYTFENHL